MDEEEINMEIRKYFEQNMNENNISDLMGGH